MKKYWVVVACAVFLGFLMMLPSSRAIVSGNTSEFKGIYATPHDDEIYYEARIAAVTRGNRGVGNIYIQEHKNDPLLHLPIAEYFVALIVWVTGFSVPFVKILCDIFIVPVGFILFYFIFYEIFKKQSTAILFSAFFFLLFLDSYGRPINPQITTVLFFMGLLIILKIYKKESLGRTLVFLNLFLGLIISLTLFVSPYFGSALMLLYVLAIPLKSFIKIGISKTIVDCRYILYTALPGFFLYVFFLREMRAEDHYAETAARLGLIHSHYPGSYTNLLFAFLATTLFFFAKKILNKENVWLIASLIVTIFVLNLQNLLTGEILQFSSHYYMVTVILVFLVLALIHEFLQHFTEKGVSVRRMGIFFFTAVIFLFLSYKQKAEIPQFLNTISSQENLILLQQKADALVWLKAHTEPDSVVYTLGGDYDLLLPVYTSNKVYYSFYASLFLMSNRETEDRWLNEQLFNPNMDKDYILKYQRDFWQNLYIDSYVFEENRRKLTALLSRNSYVPNQRISDTLIDALLKRFKDKSKLPILSVLKTYKINYILIAPEYPFYKEANEKLKGMPEVSLVYSAKGVTIYKVE